MNRAERREVNHKKWVRKLKKLWNSHTFWDFITPVKQSSKITGKFIEEHKASSWDDFKKDKFGVKCKNTGTVFTDNKWLDKQQERKRNLANRQLTKEDKQELDEYVENSNDPFAFEKYCGTCDNFPGNLGEINKREYNGPVCPFRQKFIDGIYSSDTEWKRIGCEQFWD